MNEQFRVGRALGLSFSIWFKNFIPFTLLAIILCGPQIAYALVEFGGWGGEIDLYRLLKIQSFENWLSLIGLGCGILVTSTLTYGVVMELKGQHAGMGACVAVGLKRFFPVLGVMLLMILILLVPAFIAGLLTVGLGLIGLIIGACVLGMIYAIYYVAIPASVVERPGVAGALSRSADLTRGHRGGIFGMLALIFILKIVVIFILRDVFLDEKALADDLSLVWGMLKKFYWATIVLNVISSILTGALAAVTYYLLRSEKEGTSADELAAVFE